MTRLAHVIAWTSAAALVASGALWTPMSAQAPTSSTKIAEQAKRPTPRLGGHVDLNGTWDHVDGIAFLRPQQIDGGSLCLLGCAQTTPSSTGTAAGGRATGAAPPPRQAPDFPKYKPAFVAKVADLSKRQVELDTVLRCQPPGVPRIGPPRKIVQNAREVVFLYDDVSGAFFRIIPIDGRPHRKDLSASYLGDAIGRWEGDTLVVETTNFNEETWLTDNGAFHTANLKVIERLRRVGDTIEYQAIANDPEVLAEPWALRPQTIWLTDQELEEPIHCQDRDLAHVVDGTHHDNPR